jgi:hypothetical protein
MSSSTVKTALVVAGFVAVAFVGHQRDRDQRAQLAKVQAELVEARAAAAAAEATAAARASAQAPVVVTQGIDPTVADAIAARAAAINAQRTDHEAALAAEAKAPSGDQLAARDGAQRTLDAAIARGQLRRDDVTAMRLALASDPQGAAELSRQVSVALNMGKLVPEDPRFIAP